MWVLFHYSKAACRDSNCQESAIPFRGLGSFRQEFVAEVRRRSEASFQLHYGAIRAGILGHDTWFVAGLIGMVLLEFAVFTLFRRGCYFYMIYSNDYYCLK